MAILGAVTDWMSFSTVYRRKLTHFQFKNTLSALRISKIQTLGTPSPLRLSATGAFSIFLGLSSTSSGLANRRRQTHPVRCLVLFLSRLFSGGFPHNLSKSTHVVDQRRQRDIELRPSHPDRTHYAASERFLYEAKDVLNAATYGRYRFVALLLLLTERRVLFAFLTDHRHKVRFAQFLSVNVK